MASSERASVTGIILNVVLFIAKISVGILSNSLAVLSDAFNSFTDILSYTGIHLAVRESNKRADSDHQFGHHRAEPIAGFIVAIFALILAFEILRRAVESLFSPRDYSHPGAAVLVLLFTIAVKAAMSWYLNKVGTRENSPALRAAGVDSRNDVLVSGVAVLGVAGPYLGFPVMDSFAAIFISVFIFYSGYKLGRENLDYLMGKCPPHEYMSKIKSTVRKIEGVKGINTVRAHYVGNYIHTEIHVEVDKNINTLASHDIGKKVQKAVERLEFVDKAFIHIDPV